NGGLRRVDDRRGQQRAEHATVGDGEGAAGHLLHGQLAVTRLAAELGDGALGLGQVHELGVTPYRKHQAAITGYGRADSLNAVGDGEGAAGHLLHGQLAVTRLAAELGDGALDLGQVHELGVTQYRNHQAAITGYGHADILIAVVDDVLAVDRSVHLGETLERLGGSLDEEGHEAQTHTVVLLLEQVLVLLAQVHDRLHVDFIIGSQHGHARLG